MNEEREKTCCFTGHRPGKLPWQYNENDPRCLSLKQRIHDAIELVYQQGMRTFLCGMALGCDIYFCEAALTLKKIYPDMSIEAVIPCLDQAKRWSTEQKKRYEGLLLSCDRTLLMSTFYTHDCMLRRDKYMVNHAGTLIAVWNGTPGGTEYTLRLAKQQQLRIIQLPVLISSR